MDTSGFIRLPKLIRSRATEPISSHTGFLQRDAAVAHALVAMNLAAEEDSLIDPRCRCGQTAGDVFVAAVRRVEVGPGQARPTSFFWIVRAQQNHRRSQLALHRQEIRRVTASMFVGIEVGCEPHLSEVVRADSVLSLAL